MTKYFYLVFLFFSSILGFGQNIYKAIDKKMNEMPGDYTQSTDSIAKYINANFKTENDKIRAAFYWTAANISYDLENMFEVEYNETEQQRIDKTLKSRVGICRDYAAIFSKIANATGIKTVVISGYTKQGERVSNLSHAWCGAKIDSKWYVFDPTYGSGYINNRDRTYTRNTIYSFFKIAPADMILSHMPFDYLWQFSNYPVTNKEFMDGVFGGTNKMKFDYEGKIKELDTISRVKMFQESAERIKESGMKSQHIAQAYLHAKNNWKYEKNKEFNTKMSAIYAQFNAANAELNSFIHYKNNQFQPAVSDDELRKKINSPKDKFVSCKIALDAVMEDEDNKNQNRPKLIEVINKRIASADENLQFVETYLQKSKTDKKVKMQPKYVVKKVSN